MADDAATPDGELSESTAAEPESTVVEVSDQVPTDDATEEADAASEEEAALAGLTGWLGFRAYQSHQSDEQQKLFLSVGRQGALNLTTIDWQHADADVQRILDSATGTFYDDFQKRAQPFMEVVKQAQSKSVGTIAEAGLESKSDDSAQVLVKMSVKTSNAGAPEQAPRAWRMRITVQKVGDDAKVSNVEFVP
jgi:Mce-associated membrane protein